MKQYVYRNLCENFRTNRTKNEEVIAYTSRVLRSEREQPDMTSHAAYKRGRGEGDGQMYCFFLWKLSNAFPTQVLQRNRCAWYQTLVTHETSWAEVAQYLLLSADRSLALLGDISKLDCTGQKVNRLRNRWAYIVVFGLIWKRKNPVIP